MVDGGHWPVDFPWWIRYLGIGYQVLWHGPALETSNWPALGNTPRRPRMVVSVYPNLLKINLLMGPQAFNDRLWSLLLPGLGSLASPLLE